MQENNRLSFGKIATLVTIFFMFVQSDIASRARQDDNVRFLRQMQQTESQRIEELRLHRQAEKKNISPYLSIVTCCNPRPIVRERTPFPLPGSDRLSVIRLGRPGDYISEAAKEQAGLVAEVENFGRGPALECRIDWEITKGLYDDGTEIPKEILELPSSERGYLWPKQLHSKDSGIVKSLPGCITSDADFRIASIEGKAVLSCKDISGEHHEFKEEFTLDTAYVGLKPGLPSSGDPSDYTRLSFHFNEAGQHDGPYPQPGDNKQLDFRVWGADDQEEGRHRVAKPPLDSSGIKSWRQQP